MNDTPRIFVVGASGYVGKSLYHQAKKLFGVFGTSSLPDTELLQLNLETPSDFDYQIIRTNDIIFFTAAISAPDVCVREHVHAWSVNVTGTCDFINQVMDRGARVVFFSSDTVYGERSEIFSETEVSQPAGEYAEMKSEVEKRFLGNPHFKSIRLSYVFSREDKFTRYLISCVERDDEAELFHPFNRAIIHRNDVIDGVIALAQRWDEFPQPIINFGGPEIISRVDFAEYLKQVSLPDLKYRVTEPDDSFFKNRPRTIAMKSEILPKLLGRPSLILKEAALIEFDRVD